MNIVTQNWDTIVTLWLLGLTYVLFRTYMLRKRIITMAGNWAAEMGKKSGVVRHDAAQAKHLASGKAKIVDTLAEQIPGARTLIQGSGVSDSEAFALLTDANTMKGLKVIWDTVGGALKMITPSEDRPPKKAKRTKGQAPLIEYRG